MIRRALLAAVFAACSMAGAANGQDATRLVIWYEADGSAYLWNNSKSNTYKIDGYTIGSDHNDLIVADYDGTQGWRALEDIESQFPSDVEAMTAQLAPRHSTLVRAAPVAAT